MQKQTKQRTTQQNRALHLYFTLLAEALNDAGLDQRKTLKPSVEIPWDAKAIKEQIWRPIQKAQLKKESTTELTTAEITKVWETINRHLSEKFGVTEMFPSIEEIINKQR